MCGGEQVSFEVVVHADEIAVAVFVPRARLRAFRDLLATADRRADTPEAQALAGEIWRMIDHSLGARIK